jgi:hypothetical protein
MYSMTVQGETLEDLRVGLTKAADSISDPDPKKATGKAAGTQAKSDDDKPEAEDKKPAKKAAAKKPAAKKKAADGPTADDVRKALADLAKVDGRDAALKILSDLGDCDTVSELPEDQYAEAIRLATMGNDDDENGDDEDDGF